jgi:DNA-binding Lrp family transcriptional regulator
MDDKDLAILHELQKNVRASVKQIAGAVGLSRSSVGSRLTALQRAGVIRGVQIELQEDKQAISAILLVSLSNTPNTKCFEQIADCTCVRSCVSVTGDIDVVVDMAAPSIERLNRARDRIALVDGVDRVVTLVVLARQK